MCSFHTALRRCWIILRCSALHARLSNKGGRIFCTPFCKCAYTASCAKNCLTICLIAGSLNAVVDNLGNLTCPNELPEGWEERRTPTGRIYYVNHCHRTTQWDRPTRPAADVARRGPTQSGSAQPPPLPERSIEGTPGTSGTNGTTAVERPPRNADRRIAATVIRYENLPEGYEVRTTEQGQIYFLHGPTGESQKKPVFFLQHTVSNKNHPEIRSSLVRNESIHDTFFCRREHVARSADSS